MISPAQSSSGGRRAGAIGDRISGRWRDNVFVERLWRSVKYEEVYLHADETVSDVRRGLRRYFAFFNHQRPHTAHAGRTPDAAYVTPLPNPSAVTPSGRVPKKAA